MAIQVTKISDFIYEFNEPMQLPDGGSYPFVDAYLYLGSERAVLIDTLQDEIGLYQAVREVTDLPLDVLITHGHLDHAGKSTPEFADAGCRIYMDMKDFALLQSMVPESDPAWFTDLPDGKEFNLGDRRLQTISCSGHTPGSVVFFDPENLVMFSGDTFGSGAFWMQIMGCLPMEVFEKNARSVLDRLEPFGLDRILVYPGHRIQSPVQLTGTYLHDCWHIAAGILNGTIIGKENVTTFLDQQFPCREVAYGSMLAFSYNPERLHVAG